MAIPTLKINLLPKFPANVQAGPGIGIATANATYTFSLNYSPMTQVASVSSSDSPVSLVAFYNGNTKVFNSISLTNLSASLSLTPALSAISPLNPAANYISYYTGASSAALTSLTSYGRSLIAATNAADVYTALGAIPVTAGGTGLAIGTSGGVPYFSGTTAMSSSAALANHAVVVGGGAGASPYTLGSTGTTTTLLHGNASGDPSWSTVSLTADVSGTLPVSSGGTGITSGTSGGIPAYTASGTLASSAALTQHGLVLGGGAGATPYTTGSLGTTTTVLHGSASGDPTFSAVNLTTDVTGTLAVSNGGTGAGNAATARSSAYLNVERWTPINTTIGAYNILNTDRTVAIVATFAAPRTFTLPQASTCNPGQRLLIIDAVGGISTGNALTIQPYGSDKINNSLSPLVISNANYGVELVTDGSGAWNYASLGNIILNSNLASMAALTLKGNITGGSASPSDVSLSAAIDASLGSTRGSVIYRGASGWAAYAPLNSGYVLTSNGPGADPTWQAAGGGGGSVASFNNYNSTNLRTGAVIAAAGDYVGYMIQSPLNTVSISGNTNNWNPTNLSTSQYLRVSSSAAYNITGILYSGFPNSTDGQVLYLQNVGSYNITLTDNDTTNSTPANCFSFGANFVLTPGSSVELIYDKTAGRWKSLGGNMTGANNLADLANATTSRSNLGINHSGCGRLVYSSSSQIKFSPYNGDQIKVNGVWFSISSSGITLSNSGLTAATLYYIYVYSNAGTLTLEASATVHSTDTTAGNVGVEIKTGDSTRSLVGMVYMAAGTPGTFADSVTQRFVASWFNRRKRDLYCVQSGNTASASYVVAGTSPMIDYVTWGDNSVSLNLTHVFYNSSVSSVNAAIAVDSSTVANAVGEFDISAGITGSAVNIPVNYTATLAEGRHYANILNKTSAGTIIDWSATGKGLYASVEI